MNLANSLQTLTQNFHVPSVSVRSLQLVNLDAWTWKHSFRKLCDITLAVIVYLHLRIMKAKCCMLVCIVSLQLLCCDGLVRGGFWQGAVFHESPDYHKEQIYKVLYNSDIVCDILRSKCAFKLHQIMN